MQVTAAHQGLVARFTEIMETFGPFEDRPHLAVALSGGGDSLALALLARDWVGAHRGRLTALTVDHGLRPESTKEAQRVGEMMSRQGIAHQILPWRGNKPDSGLQAAAREARYGLLRDWCGENAVLHLLLAHQADDQAETVELRRRAQSDRPGLAGMPRIRELGATRILRPLLAETGATLRGWLAAGGLSWIEDPTNRDRRFARTLVREILEQDPDSREEHLRSAHGNAHDRLVEERSMARFLARHGRLYPSGYLELDAPALVAPNHLRQILSCIGGLVHPPSGRSLERLAMHLKSFEGFAGAGLGRCVLSRHGSRLRVVRESRNLPSPQTVKAGERVIWDNRFLVENPLDHSIRVAPLGDRGDDWQGLAGTPRRARASLPAYEDEQCLAVPLPLETGEADPVEDGPRALFCPISPLSPAGFV